MRARILMHSTFASQAARALTGELDRQLGATAVGNNQATAYKLIAGITRFDSAAAGTGAILDGTSDIGDEFTVINFGAEAQNLAVYPPTAGKINNGAANASVNVASNGNTIFKRIDLVNWITK